jgi:hypothetical protein
LPAPSATSQSAGLPLPEVAPRSPSWSSWASACAAAGLQDPLGRHRAGRLHRGHHALFFHKYWSAPEAMKMMQQINFNKNIAIAGGLLAFAAFGPGRLSIDKR